MSELLNKQWPIVIKGNIFVNCISTLFGISFLVIDGFIFVFLTRDLSHHEAGDILIFIFFTGVFFFYLAFRFLYEIITTVYFKIAADEKGMCLMMRGKYVSIPNEYITSIWAGEPSYQGMPGQIGTYLIIILNKSFSPYKNPISNYLFQLSGHKIRYSQFALGVSPDEARDLLKTYWSG